MSKKYEELGITDAFMFAKVMSNKEICKPVLEQILNIKIRDIEYLDYEETIQIAPGSKSIRLDIYVEDDNNTVFNLRPFSDIDPTEKDAVFHLAFDNTAVRYEGILNVGRFGVFCGHFVLDLGINLVITVEQVVLNVPVEEIHIDLIVGRDGMQPPNIALVFVTHDLDAVQVAHQKIADKIILTA